jgi:membrane-associated phospholipid phosphatase
MHRPAIALLLVVLGWAPSVASGADELDVDLRLHLPLVVGSLALSSRLGPTPPGAPCPSCAPSGGMDVGAREALRLRDPTSARYARRGSDLLAGAAIPAGALAASALGAWHDGAPRELLEDTVVILEAATLAANLSALSKRTFARTRPDGGGGSFFSAHTARAFVLATAAGSVASLRGRESAPWIWAGGLTLATGVAYLRVAGDSHWLTDVAAGAAIGSAVGIAVPWLLHRRGHGLRRRLPVTPAPGGIRIAF